MTKVYADAISRTSLIRRLLFDPNTGKHYPLVDVDGFVNKISLNDIEKAILSEPAIQIEDDNVAHWEFSMYLSDMANCSKCGMCSHWDYDVKYCPYCGARMLRS